MLDGDWNGDKIVEALLVQRQGGSIHLVTGHLKEDRRLGGRFRQWEHLDPKHTKVPSSLAVSPPPC